MADPGPGSSAPYNHAELPTGPITTGVVTYAAKYCGSEVQRLLRGECTLIAECNVCRELFRNLTAFVEHKQTHCQGWSEECLERSSSHISYWHRASAMSGGPTVMDESSNTGSESCLQDITSEQRSYVNADSDLSGDSSGPKNGNGKQWTAVNQCHTLGAADVYEHPDSELAKYEEWQPRFGSSCHQQEGPASPGLQKRGLLCTHEVPTSSKCRRTAASSVQQERAQWVAGFDDGEGAEDEKGEQKEGDGPSPVPRGRMDSTVAASALKRSQHWHGKYDQTDCLVCNIKFVSLDHLREHMVTHHPKNNTFYECPDCKKPFSQHWGAKRHLSNFHHKSKEEMAQLRGRLKKPARLSAAEAGSLTSWSIADAGSDDTAERATSSQPLPTGPAAAAAMLMMKKKRLDLHVCSLCSKVFGSSQLMVKHEEHCLGRTSPAPAATAPGSADLATSGCGDGAALCTDALPARRFPADLAGTGWLDDLSTLAVPGGCSAAAADALLMLSQASLPTSSSPGARRSRRQPKPNRLFLDESDDDYGTQPSRPTSGEPQSEVTDLTQETPAATETDRAAADGPRKRSAIPKSRRFMDSSAIDDILDLRTLSCLICNKQLSTNFNLRRHARRHLNQRQFKCGLCAFKSLDKSDCIAHVRKCHVPLSESVQNSSLEALVIDLGELPVVVSPVAGDCPTTHRLVDWSDVAAHLAAGTATPPTSMLFSAGSDPVNVGGDPSVAPKHDGSPADL